MSARLVAVVAITCILFTGGCAKTSTTDAIAVEATDTACVPAKTQFKAGKVTFAVHNTGKEVTEMYVYGKNDAIKGEVENVGPGTTRTVTATLDAGTYSLVCKPGQQGAGIRASITVAG